MIIKGREMSIILYILGLSVFLLQKCGVHGQAMWLSGLYAASDECVEAVMKAQEDENTLRMIDYSSGDMMGQIHFMNLLKDFDPDTSEWTPEANFFFKHSKMKVQVGAVSLEAAVE